MNLQDFDEKQMKLYIYINNMWSAYELISESISKDLEELATKGAWEGINIRGLHRPNLGDR